jgi:hypothetical protein
VDPGWGLFLATFSVFFLSELVLSNFVEPALHGRHLGLSPLGIFAAASFWSVVWGPVGLLLAVPLTTCLVVVGEYVPALAFLSLIFGNRPPLTPPLEQYHRLLSSDVIGAAEALEEALRHAPVGDVLNRIVFPALRLAARDHKARKIDDAKTEILRETVAAVGELLVEDEKGEGLKTSDGDGEAFAVAILPAHGPVDALCASLVGQFLSRDANCVCRVARHGTGMIALSSVRRDHAENKVGLVLISTVGGATHKQLLILARRAAQAVPGARILACDWAAVSVGTEDQNIELPEEVIVCASYVQALQNIRLQLPPEDGVSSNVDDSVARGAK